MTQSEKIAQAKAIVMERVADQLAEMIQIDSGSFVDVATVDGEQLFVEVKFITKKDFDLDEAVEAFADKQAKALERLAESAKKKEASLKRKAEAEAKKAKA